MEWTCYGISYCSIARSAMLAQCKDYNDTFTMNSAHPSHIRHTSATHLPHMPHTSPILPPHIPHTCPTHPPHIPHTSPTHAPHIPHTCPTHPPHMMNSRVSALSHCNLTFHVIYNTLSPRFTLFIPCFTPSRDIQLSACFHYLHYTPHKQTVPIFGTSHHLTDSIRFISSSMKPHYLEWLPYIHSIMM